MTTAIPVDAIVLAAGRSTRMGTPKARLEIAPGTTFLEHTVKLLRHAGCRYVVAVVSADDDWAARLADASGAAVVVNDLPVSEQIDSLRLGLAHLPEDTQAALVLPVDIPAVKAETVSALIAAFRARRAPVTLPVHQGRGGHPVIFERAVFGELLAEPLPEGAESIVAAHAADRLEVDVDDPGINRDLNERSDYDQLRGN